MYPLKEKTEKEEEVNVHEEEELGLGNVEFEVLLWHPYEDVQEEDEVY
jgi:hypothetical protein